MKTHCKDCEWWDQKKACPKKGLCRVGPPTPLIQGCDDEIVHWGRWPTTSENDWCGAGRERVKS